MRVNLVMFLYVMYYWPFVHMHYVYGLGLCVNMALCCFADLKDTSKRMIIMLTIAMHLCDTRVSSVALYEEG